MKSRTLWAGALLALAAQAAIAAVSAEEAK